jgi:hypothetical protein
MIEQKTRINNMDYLIAALDGEIQAICMDFNQNYPRPEDWTEDVTSKFNKIIDPYKKLKDDMENISEAWIAGFL